MKSRTYYYLFIPFIYSNVGVSLYKYLINAVGNAYVLDSLDKTSDIGEPVIYLHIETTNNIEDIIADVMVQPWYRGHYLVSKTQFMIKMKVSDDAYNRFINSEYSQILSDRKVCTRKEFKNNYITHKNSETTKYHISLYAMSKSRGYFMNEIVPNLPGTVDESELEYLFNKEFDDRINIKEETYEGHTIVN